MYVLIVGGGIGGLATAFSLRKGGDRAKRLLVHDPCGDFDRFIHRHFHYFFLIAGTRCFDKYIA